MRKLLSATPSPYARKVRIALQEKNLPFELVTEVPWEPTTTTHDYNPLGKLPVLIEEDGICVYESHHILEYLELKYPDPPLVSGDIDERLAAKQFEVLADGICDACVLLFFERQREEGKQSPEWIERQTRKIEAGLAALNAQVADEFLVGGRFGLAEVAVGAAVGYVNLRYAQGGIEQKYAALGRYWRWLETRKSFIDTVPTPQKIGGRVM